MYNLSDGIQLFAFKILRQKYRIKKNDLLILIPLSFYLLPHHYLFSKAASILTFPMNPKGLSYQLNQQNLF